MSAEPREQEGERMTDSYHLRVVCDTFGCTGINEASVNTQVMSADILSSIFPEWEFEGNYLSLQCYCPQCKKKFEVMDKTISKITKVKE